ncbi:DUF4175 family protein [uncultured Chitinophaga sp.]|uniref:DUF4175 family protein n=1 Tax=uncultured Chitinophaga sp. TaxID=339340 RepID=UPI0025D0B0B2|nr:DUF4175 family protein [uncultured Chitinophaga sp.]
MIEQIRNKWVRKQVLLYLLLSLGLSLLVAIFSITIGVLVFISLFALLLLLYRPWQLRPGDVAIYLNQQFPELENSAGLFLKEDGALNLLEHLQADKIRPVIDSVSLPRRFYRDVKQAAFLLLGALFIFAIGSFWVDAKKKERITTGINASLEKPLPAGITSVKVRIEPPAYTGVSAKEQASLNITGEEDALVTWEITSEGKSVELRFNDSSLVNLKNNDGVWRAARRISKNGFYQVVLDGNSSEFYAVNVVHDRRPVVSVSAPKPFVALEYGESLKLPLQAAVTDDYGISSAVVYATIASGSGEGVKFREEQLSFPADFAAKRNSYQLMRTLDLAALHMQPGDELYFYLRATDTRGQESRSDIQIVTLADTTELMSFDGMIAGVNIKPEYFRSQRQIIIETEQLLREKDTITITRFKDHSNELGTDQKLLRLRYGKFLGEESETYGEDHDHDHDETPAFGDAKAIMEEFSHQHDNAEDATFFEPAVKQQLKAVLNEMWKAELQLRLAKPREALPFEYRALRLLKDLQQKSRAYVGKTGTKTTPLKPEKRLTGAQDKIDPARLQRNTTPAETPIPKALAALELLKSGGKPDAVLLQEVTLLVANKAAMEPSVYLPALEALKKINAGQVLEKDINAAQRGLQRMNEQAPLLPVLTPGRSGALSALYFSNLQNKKQ